MTEVVLVIQHDHPHQIWSADSSGTIRVWDAEVNIKNRSFRLFFLDICFY